MDASIDYVQRIVPATSTDFVVPAVTFNPNSLFPAIGGWWDPSDMTTLWQDVARTTQATAAGQLIGAMDDKSGNGNNLVAAANDATRPTLRNSGSLWWLEFVAANSTLLSKTINFLVIAASTDVMAIQATAWGSGKTLFDGKTGNSGRLFQTGSTPEVDMYAGGFGPKDTTHMTISTSHVVTTQWNTAASILAIDNNTNNTGNPPGFPDGLTLGGYGGVSSWSDMLFYGGIRIRTVLSGGDISSCRTFFGNKAGLSL